MWLITNIIEVAHPHNERTFKSLQLFFQQEFEIENLENGIFYFEILLRKLRTNIPIPVSYFFAYLENSN